MAPVDQIEQDLARLRIRRRVPGPGACRLIREQAGVSMRAVARALNVEPSTVLRWERGLSRPRAAVAADYVDVLGRLADEAGLKELFEAEVALDERQH